LLLVHTGEAIADTGVSGDLTGLNERVGILGLDNKLHTLDGSGSSLGDGTGDTCAVERIKLMEDLEV
jgi:hypothetical protein